MIRGFLPAWDFARRHVDVGPVVDWALHVLDTELGLRPHSLERLHMVTDVAGAQRASQMLTALNPQEMPSRTTRRRWAADNTASTNRWHWSTDVHTGSPALNPSRDRGASDPGHSSVSTT